ncbi:hypothetical protein WICPIJ_004132 [Wickerhamomyces pijperi]|uniref:Arrestin C-terminal-like domain-containing protein n=1 Tax=Wickerhamomyces pijperi TaxID=599730 RepID=A0A9P8TN71_WICPI|nr:hypothetical protein WICPIJ_004132 [Wickerhamomyces pijperi]
MIDLSVALTASNSSIVKGCSGVPGTYPRIQTKLELRSQTPKQSIIVNNITVRFTTTDSFIKGKPHSDVPQSFKSIRHELNFPIDKKIVSLDVPILIPIPRDIAPTSNNLKIETKHNLEVEVHFNNHKSLKREVFPVVISTYNHLPIFGEFNELITKTIDSSDHKVILEYSLPTNAIGPNEDLIINCKVLNNQSIVKNLEKIKLKSIKVELLEIFDCRCDRSFTKVTALQSNTIDLNGGEQLGYDGLLKRITFRVDQSSSSETLIKLQTFHKHQDPSLLVFRKPEEVYDPSRNIVNTGTLIPDFIDNYKADIQTLSSYGNFTKKSTNFQISFELKMSFNFNSAAKDMELKIPIIISNYDRVKSEKLWGWIQDEVTLKNQFLKRINKDKITYDQKFNPVRFPQTPYIIHE